MESIEIHSGKKIGILTLSASDNCGSLLQAYALERVLSRFSSEVEMINFQTKKSKKMYRIFHPSYIKTPKKLFGLLLFYPQLKEQKKSYQEFRDRYLHLTKTMYTNQNDLFALSNNYDIVVCGSDQIWNTNMADFDKAYLLGWYKFQKVSYAASLGDQKNNKLDGLKAYKEQLDSFSHISVREKSSQKKMQEYLNIWPELCLDPTLLISKKEWEKLLASEKEINHPFIFYYSYNYADNVCNEMVQKYAEYKKLPVYVINASKWVDGKIKKYGFRIYHKSGPLAFLSLIKQSEYSLVESFHGTVFAYIFQKQFWFLKNTNNDFLDDRINDIMEILNMKDRVLKPGEVVTEKINTMVQYNGGSEEYLKLLRSSRYYLQRVLETE